MYWYIWLAIGIMVIGLVIFLIQPLKIPREPYREGEQDSEASRDYNKVSHWPVFAVERYLILHGLRKLKPGGLLVDVGCGPGYLTISISKNYPDMKIIGLDNNINMINIASYNWPLETHDNIEFIEGDVQQLPFADKSIDCIVSSLSLHHWPDAGEACKEINRVLKSGGQFLIFDLKRNSPRIFFYFLWLGQLMSPKAIKRTNGAIGSLWSSYTPRELQKIFLEQSWQNLQVEGKPGWLIVSAVRS